MNWRQVGKAFAIATPAAVLLFAYRYLDDLARAHPPPLLEPLIEEFTGVYGAALLFFPIRMVARRFPIDRVLWWRHLPVHACAVVLFSLVGTTWNWGTRELLFPLAGLGNYDYGIMPVRYAMEFPLGVILYAVFVSAVWLTDRYAAARAQELQAARLERRLAEAELAILRGQLQPHFLFNALNTISSVMYDDPAAADRMLAHLAELLRASLGSADAQEVALAAEIELLDHYLALMRARFGEDLSVAVEVDPAVAEAAVPPLLLQPLVENAVRHGNLPRLGHGRIRVVARSDGPFVAIDIEDDGPGAPPGVDVLQAGFGLSGTAARLRLLYGGRHRFEAGNGGAGFRVSIRLPFRPAGRRSAAALEGTTVHAGAHR